MLSWGNETPKMKAIFEKTPFFLHPFLTRSSFRFVYRRVFQREENRFIGTTDQRMNSISVTRRNAFINVSACAKINLTFAGRARFKHQPGLLQFVFFRFPETGANQKTPSPLQKHSSISLLHTPSTCSWRGDGTTAFQPRPPKTFAILALYTIELH